MKKKIMKKRKREMQRQEKKNRNQRNNLELSWGEIKRKKQNEKEENCTLKLY